MLQCKGYYLPDLKIRLFSPQTFLQEHKTGRYSLEWDKSIFELHNGDTITIGYQRQTSLPILRGFNEAMKTAKSLALSVLADDSNQNLTSHHKRLFTWHTRWGHLGVQHAQCIGHCGLLGPMVIKMGLTTVQPPKCAACQLGKQQQTPKNGSKP